LPHILLDDRKKKKKLFTSIYKTATTTIELPFLCTRLLKHKKKTTETQEKTTEQPKQPTQERNNREEMQAL
jgi:hypothetical protein